MGCIQSMGAEANAPKHLLSNFSVTFLYKFCMEIISINPFHDKPKTVWRWFPRFAFIFNVSLVINHWGLSSIIEVSMCLNIFQEGSKPPAIQNCWVVWRSKPCQKLKTSHFLLPRLWSHVNIESWVTLWVQKSYDRHSDMQECPVMPKIVFLKVPNLIRYLAVNDTAI